jgi:hypothetical protein
VASSHGFYASRVLPNGLPAPGLVTEGVEHMLCAHGGRMWQFISRITLPVEPRTADAAAASPLYAVMSRRLDMTSELADLYTPDA